MNISSINQPLISSNSFYFPSDSPDENVRLMSNHTLPLLQFHSSWIFLLFILCLIGILLTIIILFIYLYWSIRHLNDHLILPNLFICFSICFIYIIIIIYFIRPNQFLCGLREFLSQIGYVLLFSGLLTRYIMQWLSTRILSKQTKHLTSLLIYFLLIFIQIPIGILWWYFTNPHRCHLQIHKTFPPFKFHFQKKFTRQFFCSYQCIVDYRFYGTYTYIIFQLIICTIISICLFFYRCFRRNNNKKNQANNDYKFLTFLNMFAFLLIDIVWLIWTLIYYFTHSFFVYPAILIGMFIISTICLLLILTPEIFYSSKNSVNHMEIPKTTLFSNKLASTENIKDHDSLIHNKSKQQTLSNDSEISYELGTSGTFLPITKTPKGPFKVTNIDKRHQLVYRENENNQEKFIKNDKKTSTPTAELTKQLMVPLQRQLTSSSLASDFVSPSFRTEPLQQSHSNIHPSSSSMYYSSYIPPYHDETLIPILCTSQRQQTSTPVKMRILVKSSSSSVPTTRRIHSGNDHRYIQQYPYHYRPLPPPTTPIYYPPSLKQQQQYSFIDPYRTMPSYSSGHLWPNGMHVSHRYPYPYRKLHPDNRTLSQRLWDIDSGDDQDDIEEPRSHTQGHITPTKERLNDFRSSNMENTDQMILHINDDDAQISDNRKLVFI